MIPLRVGHFEDNSELNISQAVRLLQVEVSKTYYAQIVVKSTIDGQANYRTIMNKNIGPEENSDWFIIESDYKKMPGDEVAYVEVIKNL